MNPFVSIIDNRPHPSPVIVNCDSSSPMTLSAATWNLNYVSDPTNLSEWAVVDSTTCSGFPYVVLVVNGVPVTTQYSILQAPRYSASVFGPAITSPSTLTPQLSSGTTITVGWKPIEASFFYSSIYSITAQ